MKRPTETPLHRFTLGTYDQQIYGQLDLGGPIEGAEGVSYRLNLAYADPGQTGVESQTEERYVLSGALDWQIAEGTKLALDAGRSRRELEYAQALFMTSARIGIPDAPDASKNWGPLHGRDGRDHTGWRGPGAPLQRRLQPARQGPLQRHRA